LRDRFGRASSLLALAGAMLWAVHPLQTESVTYIIQRAESLMGLFYLLTLYCVIRGAGPAQWLWYVAAVLACLLGMATKEVMATAPLAVLLYDRTFLAGSFAEAWRRRWGLYVGLATTWGVLAYVVLSAGLIGHYSELGAPDPWSYARTQPGVILHYLRLSVWPSTLCLQYDWPVPNGLAEILPGALVVALLLAATAWGLMKRKAYGFLGAWFLLILAPTSSILPLGQLAADHRMYLPLAAVAALGAASGHVLWEKLLSRSAGQGGQSPFSPDMTPGRVGWWAATKGTVPGAAPFLRWAAPMAVLAAALGALGSATVQRNSDYRSLLAIWQDTVHKDPGNALAHTNLAVALDAAGRTAEAIEHFHVALRLKPNLAEAHANLGIVLANHGRLDEAIKQYQQALQLKPRFAESHHALADALAGLGRTDEAIEHYRQAVRLKPDYAEAHHAWADALAAVGSTEEALEHYRHALRLNPENAEAHNNLGIALLQSRQPGEAIAFPGGLENQARFRRGPQ
jgi:tetratricopeptide (TPR) repeat protein